MFWLFVVFCVLFVCVVFGWCFCFNLGEMGPISGEVGLGKDGGVVKRVTGGEGGV